MPGGGLAAEHVPWLLKAGVRQLHLGDQVRPGGSAKAYVDAGYVRSWRSMVDDVVDGLPTVGTDDPDRPAPRALARPDVAMAMAVFMYIYWFKFAYCYDA